ncbi:putative ribonuclease H-like domain-containing protein [Tanacetum coccineum]
MAANTTLVVLARQDQRIKLTFMQVKSSSQSMDKYVAEILKKFDFASVKTASTPIETQKPLVKDEEASDVDVHLYRSMIGSLMYVTASRPDIMFAVCAYSSGSSVDERGKTHHGKTNLFQETPKPLCSTFLPTDVKHCLNVGYTFVNFATSEAVWKSHVCITRKSWPLFKSKKIAQVVRAWIQSKNSLVKHFEDMRLYRPSKEYLPVWFNPPRDMSMSCLTTKGMRNNGAMCARRFRESLRRVTEGAEAFLILTLFILCLDKVPKPIRIHLNCTLNKAISLQNSSLQALISLTDDLSLLSNMAALESCPKHNMIAYLEKTEGNVEFHEVIDFLRRSYIYHALTVSPVVSTTFVEQFWTSAKSKTINNVRHITAKVAGKFVSISEASIRTDLIFDDADGIDSLPNQAIFDAIQLMGYEGDLTVSDQAKEIKLLKAKIIKLKMQLNLVHKESVSKQGRKKAKGESSVQRDPLFDVMPEDKIDHMETKNAQSEGRTREMVDEDKEFDEDRLSTEDVVSTDKEGVSTDFEKVSTDRPIVSTDGSKVSTDEQVEGTEEIFKGTEDQTKEEIATKASQTSTQTPTSMIFGDDETIATLLLNMSQAKAASKEKEKGVELKDVEEIDRPGYFTRYFLTLSLLPKIDPNEKGSRRLKGRMNLKARIEADRILAEKLQEQEREQFTIEKRAKFLHDTIAAQRKFLAQQRSEAIRNRPPQNPI